MNIAGLLSPVTTLKWFLSNPKILVLALVVLVLFFWLISIWRKR